MLTLTAWSCAGSDDDDSGSLQPGVETTEMPEGPSSEVPFPTDVPVAPPPLEPGPSQTATVPEPPPQEPPSNPSNTAPQPVDSAPGGAGGAPEPTPGGAGGQLVEPDPGDAGAGGSAAGGMAPVGDGLGTGTMMGMGSSSERYETAFVSRNDVPYILITNGWGPGFSDHTISWDGSSFIVQSMNGSAGTMGQPASYPTVFCGRYSVMEVPDCGLPAPRDTITSLKTGWRWAANGNEGEYNAAYDIWVGTGTQLQGYLMVWLRDPPSFQPAGSPNMAHQGVTVEGVPGVWNIWDGMVNGLPIINWVRAEGDDSTEIEFDVLSFLSDAEARGLGFPGSHINSVAVGFEIWEGPITNLESLDFYVHVN